jgi:hypothetical protein
MNAPRRRLVQATLALACGLVLAPGFSAQTPTPAPEPAAREAPRKKVRRNSSKITAEEIREAAASHPDGFLLVQSLRPAWFRMRGVSSINRSEMVRVYVDGMPMGGPGTLRQVDATIIGEMEYLDGPTATQRFGTDHGAGAILLRTRS